MANQPGDRLDRFAAAVKARENAESAVQRLIESLKEKIGLLATWRQVQIVAEELNPDDYRGRAERTVHAREWPSAERMHTALVAWHDADLKVRSEWDEMTEQQQSVLKPVTFDR